MYWVVPLSGCPSDGTCVRDVDVVVHIMRQELDCSRRVPGQARYLSLSKIDPVAAILAENPNVAVLWIF